MYVLSEMPELLRKEGTKPGHVGGAQKQHLAEEVLARLPAKNAPPVIPEVLQHEMSCITEPLGWTCILFRLHQSQVGGKRWISFCPPQVWELWEG